MIDKQRYLPAVTIMYNADHTLLDHMPSTRWPLLPIEAARSCGIEIWAIDMIP